MEVPVSPFDEIDRNFFRDAKKFFGKYCNACRFFARIQVKGFSRKIKEVSVPWRINKS